MVLSIPTIQDVVSEVKDNPDALRDLVGKNSDLLNIVMQMDAKNATKYVRLSEEDQKRLTKMKKNGIAEGVIIGLAVALFFAKIGELFK